MFALRTALRPLARNYSSSSKLVDVAVNDQTGIATVTLQRLPVNGLNLELLSAFSNTLTELDENRTRGMILTSAGSTVFSAGLDIMEMYKPDPARAKEFWNTLQEMWMKLYGSPYPTAAAINGHSPAGGCLMAASCEYRVMVENYTIGLNETLLGIVAPFWFISTLRNTIGKRQAELALTTGRLFKTDEALNVGLVDEIATDKADAVAKCEKFLAKFAKIHPLPRALTKASLRKADIEELLNKQEEDIEMFLSYVTNPQVQKALEGYLASLKKKAAK